MVSPHDGIILCSSSLARYTLDTLPNKVMTKEYQLALSKLKRFEAELRATRRGLERAGRKGCGVRVVMACADSLN